MTNDSTNVNKSNLDRTHKHSWFFEDATVSPSLVNVLTADGLKNIASHKYIGSEYTHLDNLLNPVWDYVTNLLPMWIAPNMVTTIGGLHCLTAYLLIWYYSPNMDTPIPNYVIFLSGYCTVAYYTFDCMDGKQSRRTGTSSPLGQLFDHGVDCLCNIYHSAITAAYLTIGGTPWFFAQLSSLQLAFFCAQWEEYYTHVLPHGCGKWLGTTEINYGLGLLTIVMAFVDREELWVNTTVGDVYILQVLPAPLHSLSLGQFGILGWLILSIVMVILCLIRVDSYLRSHHCDVSVRLSALSKLVSPIILAISPFVLPNHIIENQTRQLSLALGIIFSIITKKMIVFSMAKMSYAALQVEILPYILWVLYMTSTGSEESTISSNILTLICCWHLFRLFVWCGCAISQIKERLDIYCFTIKKVKKEDNANTHPLETECIALCPKHSPSKQINFSDNETDCDKGSNDGADDYVTDYDYEENPPEEHC